MRLGMTCGVLAAACLVTGAADATTVVFTDDFSGGAAKAEFSGVTTVVSAPPAATFSGSPFADNILKNDATGNPATATTLSLSGLAAHTSITISFDFLALDTWDGTAGGAVSDPDFFDLHLDGVTILDTLFSVDNFFATSDVSIPSAFSQLLATTGRGTPSAYHVAVTVAHTASTAVFDFFALGAGWQGGADESWAIDNVVVRTDAVAVPPPDGVVPLPAGIWFLLTALGGLAAQSRFRT